MQPPQDPYNQPNFAQPSPNPYGAPVPQQPRGTVSLDVVGEAWNLVKASLGQWIGAVIIVFLATFAVSFIVNLIQIPFAPPSGQNPGAGFYIVLLGGQIVSFVVTTVLFAGLIKMAINQVKTGSASLGDIGAVTEVIGPLLLAALLVALVTYAGIILCIVPGIIAALGLAMTQPLIVDQKAGAIDAMKSSWAVMKPNLGSFFVLGLVLFLVNLVGVIPCGLGLLVTYPISVVAIALVYRDLFGIGGTPVQNTGYTPPPIANPNF